MLGKVKCRIMDCLQLQNLISSAPVHSEDVNSLEAAEVRIKAGKVETSIFQARKPIHFSVIVVI